MQIKEIIKKKVTTQAEYKAVLYLFPELIGSEAIITNTNNVKIIDEHNVEFKDPEKTERKIIKPATTTASRVYLPKKYLNKEVYILIL